MSEEKNIFNELVQKKLQDFEVPYDEAHWKEMNQRLDEMGPLNPPVKSLTSYGYVILAAAGVAVLTTILLWPVEEQAEINLSTTAPQKITVAPNTAPATEKNTPSASETSMEVGDQSIATPEKEVLKGGSTPVTTVEGKVEKLATYSEEKRKEDAKQAVAKIVADQKESFKDEPKIDNPELKTGIVVVSKSLCAGQEVQFEVDHKIEGATYAWNFGDKGLTSRKMNPTHTFNRPGTFEIMLIVSRGEKNTNAVKKTVVIEATPELDIVIEDKPITLFDPYIALKAHSDIKATYSWRFRDQQASDKAEVEFFVPESGSYPIELTARSENGCIAVLNDQYVTQKGFKMFVETAFTANGDMNNQEFIPKELKITDASFTFLVRDKSGQIVFESHDGANAWNGNLNNVGSALPAGMYLWTVTIQDIKGVKRIQDGKIQLIR